MTIDIEEFKKMQDFFSNINSMTIDEIEIEGIEILNSVRDDFKMIGRNNTDLVDIVIEASERGENPLGDLWKEEEIAGK